MSFITNLTSQITQIGSIVKKSFGPLAALEQRNYTLYSTLRYPLEVGNPDLYPHTIEFQCFTPVPANSSEYVDKIPPPSAIPKVSGDVVRGTLTPKIKPTMAIIDHQNSKEFSSRNTDLSATFTDFERRAEPSDLIAMYLPQGAWNDRVTNDYQTKSITEAMGVAGLAAEAASSALEAIKAGESIVESVKLPFWELITGAIASKVGADPATLSQTTLLVKGYAKNPQFEVLYSGTQMREFQFDFTMTPRNEKEANTCISIINRFKYHASPQLLRGGGRYIIPPSYFGIEFKYKNSLNLNLPRISTCVLQTVDVNYSGGLEQWASYRDGMPLQIQMVLNFVELEAMHKALRDIGY
jgi:hypothetical protein